MKVSFPVAVSIVLAASCVFAAGNYMVNRKEMAAADNWHETRMWGTAFAIYAALDYLLIVS